MLFHDSVVYAVQSRNRVAQFITLFPKGAVSRSSCDNLQEADLFERLHERPHSRLFHILDYRIAGGTVRPTEQASIHSIEPVLRVATSTKLVFFML